MKRAACFLVLMLAAPAAALAQSPPPQSEPETVYTEAQREKDEQLSRRFVQSLLSPSLNLAGQFAKWNKPLCVHVAGLAAAAAHVVEQRIREVGQQVGVPIERRDPCTPNAVIFVTPEPLATLDALAAKDMLRFVAGSRADLKVRFPVQSWYTGYFVDYKGFPHLDIPWVDALYGSIWTKAEDSNGNALGPEKTDHAEWISSGDTRLQHGIKPEMGNITIVVDANKIAGMTLGSLADYLTLMTLSQTPATGRCQPAPSIANLFLKDCEEGLHVTSLSAADLAMLTALYQTPLEPENLQMARIVGNMRHNLEAEAHK